MLPTQLGFSVSVTKFADLAVVPFARAGNDIRAQMALDGGALFVLRQRADIAPTEGGDRVAGEEVVPSLAQLPAELRFLASRRQLLQEFQRADVARLIDQRRHIIRIKPEDVVVLADGARVIALSRRHREGGGQCGEVEVTLPARRQVQADAVIGIAIAVPVLAIEEAGGSPANPARSRSDKASARRPRLRRRLAIQDR